MNIFRVPSHGQPLLARQNKTVYLIVILAAIVVAVFFLVRYILKQMKSKKTSPEWIAAQKKRITQHKDVDTIAEKLKLTKEESQLLWDMCKANKTPNIVYLLDDAEAIDELFKKEFFAMEAKNTSPDAISVLFKLRHKIDEEIASGITITSTMALTENTKFTCYMNSGQQVSCQLIRNTQDGLLLEIPQQLYESPERPPELSKTIFTFNFPSITRYEFTTRVVRYEIGVSGKPGMVISHSNSLKISAKRSSRRIEYVKRTSFYAVEVSEENSHKKFTRKEKAYKCAILNISGGGCCIVSPLPIKENQYIDLDIPIGENLVSASGRIVETRKLDENKFALHIAFVRIPPEAQNKIYATTYGYFS